VGKKYADFTPAEKAAHKQKVRDWRRANPDKVKAWRITSESLLRKRNPRKRRQPRTDDEIVLKVKDLGYRKLGVSLERVAQILAAQGGKCAICERALLMVRQNNSLECPNLDHCHTTLKIRGVLCRPCNQWLGLYEGNREFLKKSDEYLANHPSWGELKKRGNIP
jgi:recombination endonuclease VII